MYPGIWYNYAKSLRKSETSRDVAGSDAARNRPKEPPALRAQRLRQRQRAAHRHHVSQLVIDALSRDDCVGSYRLSDIVAGVDDARAELARAFGLEDGD